MVHFEGTVKRPVRLTEETRAFAEESLKGKYGDEAKRVMTVSCDDIEGFEALSGGEPMMQSGEALSLLEEAKRAGILSFSN